MYVYPDEEFLENYEGNVVADMISTLSVNAMLGEDEALLGDSGVAIRVQTLKQGEEGIKEFKNFSVELLKKVKESVPNMSKQYADFYEHFLKDFRKNGMIMPMVGKILNGNEID